MTQPNDAALRSELFEQANLVSAMEFLLGALASGPKCYSALCFGRASRGIPQSAMDAAQAKIGVELYHDEYGIAMWRLGRAERPAYEIAQ